MTVTFFLRDDRVRKRAAEYIIAAPTDYVVQVKPKTRSLEQNARLWALLRDVSEQVDWYGRKLSPAGWKDIFSASLKKQDVVPGIDGGFVVMGQHTSLMSIKEMSDLMTLIESFGASRGVQFKDEQ